MPKALKESLKFAAVFVVSAGLLVGASFLMPSAKDAVEQELELGIVRELVPGARPEGPVEFDVAGASARAWRTGGADAVVFAHAKLFDRTERLAIRIEKGKAVGVMAERVGMPPWSGRVGRTIRLTDADLAGRQTAAAGVDALGGATIDRARLRDFIIEVQSAIGKAGAP